MNSEDILSKKPNNNKKILIFKNISQISNFVIKKWVEISEKAIKNRERFTVALSGGKTPVNLYRKLADLKNPLPWNKTHIFLVDERFVPYEDSRSNYRMINQTLLSRVKILKENVHSISAEGKIPQASAAKYEENLISFFKLSPGEFPRFDLILLGIGEDGHTASLFPDISSLTETKHLAIVVSPPDISKNKRITLTLSVINNAENIIFIITGSNKALILKETLEKRNSRLPAAMVRPKKGRLFFLIDEAAASHVSTNAG